MCSASDVWDSGAMSLLKWFLPIAVLLVGLVVALGINWIEKPERWKKKKKTHLAVTFAATLVLVALMLLGVYLSDDSRRPDPQAIPAPASPTPTAGVSSPSDTSTAASPASPAANASADSAAAVEYLFDLDPVEGDANIEVAKLSDGKQKLALPLTGQSQLKLVTTTQKSGGVGNSGRAAWGDARFTTE
jgi:hypothetical protein